MKKLKPFAALYITFQTALLQLCAIPAHAEITVSESGEDMAQSIGVASAFFLWGITVAGLFSVIAGVYKIVVGMSEDHNAKDVSLGIKMILGGIAGMSIVLVLKEIGILA